MDDYLISQFIDNELDIEEKRLFVDSVHNSREFTRETISFLEQEKLLQMDLGPWEPSPIFLENDELCLRTVFQSWWQPMAAFAAAMIIAFFIFSGMQDHTQQEIAAVSEFPAQDDAVNYRFVLSQEAEKVEIIGSFTNWKTVPMTPTGAGHYWEINLPVVRGEHQYSFIVDGQVLLPDPTVAARVPDDFGTINSVIRVEV